MTVHPHPRLIPLWQYGKPPARTFPPRFRQVGHLRRGGHSVLPGPAGRWRLNPRQADQAGEQGLCKDPGVSMIQSWVTLSFQQMIDFFTDFLQIIHVKIDNGISDIGNLVQFFQTRHNHITDNPGGYFRPAHLLQGRLNFTD